MISRPLWSPFLSMSTILPVDVEIGRSSFAGLAILANISENPAELDADVFSSFLGAVGLGGGAGRCGG